MSTQIERFSRAAIFCFFVLIFSVVSNAQEIDVKIKIASGAPETAIIEGRILPRAGVLPTRNWSFVNSTIGAANLGERISEFRLTDEADGEIFYRKLASGEYLSEKPASSWSYKINLKPPADIIALAHVSSVAGETGILMLDDLLPQFSDASRRDVSARVEFEMPPDWKIKTRERENGKDVFFVERTEKAVFAVGKNWRAKFFEANGAGVNLAIGGEWKFSDEEAAKMADEIFRQYADLFGSTPAGKIQIIVLRFPDKTAFGRWSAETRGANLVVFSSDMPFKTVSLQRLHEQLRHEIFHLWIPNNLALSGNYDWFYEGFAVYTALRSGVETNQIRFEDFLSTLAEAFDFDKRRAKKVSLIEASKNRRFDAGNQIYSRGMIVAFLCDIALLRQSKTKDSVKRIFRELYEKHRRPNAVQDGNAAILSVLEKREILRPIIEKYVTGAEEIEWKRELEIVGIESSETNSFTKLSVKKNLRGREKDLLNELGYNNWRKISENKK